MAPRQSRGGGEVITTCKRLSPSDDIEFLPETDEVRLVFALGPDGPIEEVRPVTQWAELQCARVASSTLRPVIADRFGVSTETIGVGIGVNHESKSTSNASVSVMYQFESEFSFDELVAATPQTVRTTIEFANQDYTHAISVFVEWAEFHLTLQR